MTPLPECPDEMIRRSGASLGFAEKNYSVHDNRLLKRDVLDDSFQCLDILLVRNSAPQVMLILRAAAVTPAGLATRICLPLWLGITMLTGDGAIISQYPN